jgi:hypothetical protein
VKNILLIPLFAVAAAAAPQLELGKNAAPPAAQAPVPAPGQPYWFKTYSTAPYSEIWTGDLALKDFSRDLLKAVDAVQKNGGTLTQELKNFVSSTKDPSQQLTFTLPKKNAPALLKALRKLGDMKDPAVRAMGVPIPLDEVRAKIAVMMKEKSERGAELARVPAAAAAEEEILEHLLMVEELAARVDVEVRFNLLVRQK